MPRSLCSTQAASRLRLELLGADAVGRHDAAAQHRHALELGAAAPASRTKASKRVGLGRTGCRGRRTTAPCPAARAVNCRRRLPSISITRDQQREAEAERQHDASASARPAGGCWRAPAAARSSAARGSAARDRHQQRGDQPQQHEHARRRRRRRSRAIAPVVGEQRWRAPPSAATTSAVSDDVAPARPARAAARPRRGTAPTTGTSCARPSGQSAKASAVSRP